MDLDDCQCHLGGDYLFKEGQYRVGDFTPPARLGSHVTLVSLHLHFLICKMAHTS